MKEKNIYDRNGFINIPAIYNIPVPFIFIVGGRGTGKTYGVCKYAIEKKIKFALMRRTQTQADLISKPEFSPLKPVLGDMNRMFKAVSLTKQNSAFYETDMEGTIISPEPFCYSLALSTISNMRGFDASDISLIFYDEFIAEAHERPLKNEAEAFFNCYETINRNRELKGIPPVKVICAANSNNMANELFISLGLVLRAEKMYQNGTSIWIDKERGLALIICQDSPVSEAKEKTALYNLVSRDSDFYQMSLKNVFTKDRADNIGSRNIKEFKPLVHIGEMYIYRHKSRQEYYVTSFKSGVFKENYTMSENDKVRFRLKYRYLWIAFLSRSLFLENYIIQVLFTKCFT